MTVVAMLALVAFGIFSLLRLQTDEFPNVQQPVLSLVLTGPLEKYGLPAPARMLGGKQVADELLMRGVEQVRRKPVGALRIGRTA